MQVDPTMQQVLGDISVLERAENLCLSAAKVLATYPSDKLSELHRNASSHGFAFGQDAFPQARQTCQQLEGALNTLSPQAKKMLLDGKSCEGVCREWKDKLYKHVWGYHQKLSKQAVPGYFGLQPTSSSASFPSSNANTGPSFSFGAFSPTPSGTSQPAFGFQSAAVAEATSQLSLNLSIMPTDKLLQDVEVLEKLAQIAMSVGSIRITSKDSHMEPYKNLQEIIEDAHRVLESFNTSMIRGFSGSDVEAVVKKELPNVRKVFHSNLAEQLALLSNQAKASLKSRDFEDIIKEWDKELERRNHLAVA
jgi:hypothetical protein